MEVIIITLVLPNLFLLVLGLTLTLLCLSKDVNFSTLWQLRKTSHGHVGATYWGSYGGISGASGENTIELPKCKAAPVHDPGDVTWDEGPKKLKKK